MTWTVLPQRFRDSPHLFGQALSRDLLDLDLGPNGKILQYVDDLLICSPDEKSAQQHAVQVLNFLAERGYKVSHAKAQMVETKVIYLRVQITHGSRRLSSDQLQGTLHLPSPMTRKQLRAFLRPTGYCRIWIPNYGLIAQPLYESLKGRDDSIPLMWGTPQKKAEATLKQPLTQTLRLPDPEKSFQLYVHEREGIALGVLTQRLESEPQPVAYYPRDLIQPSKAGPPAFEILQLLQS